MVEVPVAVLRWRRGGAEGGDPRRAPRAAAAPAGRSLRFVTLPEGQDPDDLVKAKGAGAMEALLRDAQPLVDRLWQSEVAAEPLDTPEQRAGLKRRLNEWPAPSPIRA